VRQECAATGEVLQVLLEAELNATIEPRWEPPLRFLLIDGPGPASCLVATWSHALMSPRGAQGLLAALARLDECEDGCAVPLAGPDDPERRPLRERGRIARRSLAYMRTLAPVPPVSPGGRLVAAGPVRFLQRAFGARDLVGAPRATRDISWRLAVVGRAMAELWQRRGLPDVPFLLPISVDLRPKGDDAIAFGNPLAFHFARFRPSETADLPALAKALRRQMADAVRDGHIDANAVAMEFLKYRPLSRVASALPWSAGGETFSFNCADVSDFPAMPTLFGRRVRNAWHVPCVLPRPGIGVFFNRCDGRDNVVVAWVEGAVTAEEAGRVLDSVGETMAWAPQA
jgi:hypothetical protein